MTEGSESWFSKLCKSDEKLIDEQFQPKDANPLGPLLFAPAKPTEDSERTNSLETSGHLKKEAPFLNVTETSELNKQQK